MLAKKFKDRDSLFEWIKNNKKFLEDEIGIEFLEINICDDLLIAVVKNHPYFKVIINPDFKFTWGSLYSIEKALETKLDEEKYIGVVMLAESFPEELCEYYQILKNHVNLVLPLYLKLDKDNKPVFSYPDLSTLIA